MKRKTVRPHGWKNVTRAVIVAVLVAIGEFLSVLLTLNVDKFYMPFAVAFCCSFVVIGVGAVLVVFLRHAIIFRTNTLLVIGSDDERDVQHKFKVRYADIAKIYAVRSKRDSIGSLANASTFSKRLYIMFETKDGSINPFNVKSFSEKQRYYIIDETFRRMAAVDNTAPSRSGKEIFDELESGTTNEGWGSKHVAVNNNGWNYGGASDETATSKVQKDSSEMPQESPKGD